MYLFPDMLVTVVNWFRTKRKLSRENRGFRCEIRELRNRLELIREQEAERWRAELDHQARLKDEQIESLKVQLQAAIDSLDRISAANTVEAAYHRSVLRERQNGGVLQR